MIHYIAEMFRANYHCDKHPVTSRVFADPVVAGVVDLDTAVAVGIVDPVVADLAVADLGVVDLGVADPDAVDQAVVDLGAADPVVADPDVAGLGVVGQVVVDLDAADPDVVDQVVVALAALNLFVSVLQIVFCPVAADHPVVVAIVDHHAMQP